MQGIGSVFYDGLGKFHLKILTPEGPKLTSWISSLGIVIGCVLMAFHTTDIPTFVPGFIFLSGTGLVFSYFYLTYSSVGVDRIQ